MKRLLVVCLSMCSLSALAQKTDTYFFKIDGHEVSTRDSADFIRIVSEPDSGSKYLNLVELFPDNKRRMAGQISSLNPLILQGLYISYYRNGNRMRISNYLNGIKVNDEYEYYSNGKLHMVVQYPPSASKYKFNEDNRVIKFVYDTLGNEIISNGKGYMKYHNIATGEVMEEGPLDEGLRNGEWKGLAEKGKIHYTENYENGKLVAGKAID